MINFELTHWQYTNNTARAVLLIYDIRGQFSIILFVAVL